jgi:prevent-host-death family protein
MAEIGIRELKAKTSEIVREVRQHQASYVVTHRGKPVGLLSPYEETSEITTPATEYDADAWGELRRLGDQITERWTSPKTSAELLSEMRR